MPEATSHLTGFSGPRLVDVNVDVPSVRIAVSHPGHGVTKLRLATSLSRSDGATRNAFRDLCDRLVARCHCGAVGTQDVVIDVVDLPAGESSQMTRGFWHERISKIMACGRWLLRCKRLVQE